MARLVLCAVALFVATGLADPVPKPILQKPVDKTTLERQHSLLILFFHVHEPNHFKENQEIEKTWDFEKNVQLYANATAVYWVSEMIKNGWNLPKAVPFSILETAHKFEAEAIFDLLYSAKDFDTFYKTAVYLRPHLNEYLFVYVLSTAIYHHHDLQGIIAPPIYNVFPSFFFNAEVINTAQRVAVHGKRFVEHYPHTYLWDDNVVIEVNETLWPYVSEEMPISYYTHDVDLNALYYNVHLTYPFWLGKDKGCPLVNDRRGELFWFWHKQFMTRYYMERLSNGMGEISELDWTLVSQGYNPGLAYMNGVAFPYRPDYYHLDTPWVHEILEEIQQLEYRITDAIAKGHIYDESDKYVSLHDPDDIDLLGRIVEGNVDSPTTYYQDFITLWKKVLGNSPSTRNPTLFHKGIFPLIVPSTLEHYQTALRDPAFYMIWKRVLKIFQLFHKALPKYTEEELSLPSVEIEKIEVDKLVTYLEYTYINITNVLHMNEFECEHVYDTKSVLVKRPRLNHKVFTIRVTVKSASSKHVSVRFFLAPKYDSTGREIPLVENTQNFFLVDQFEHMLQEGENVIIRDSNQNLWTSVETYEGYELFKKVEDALNGGEFFWEAQRQPDGFPRRLILPKGQVGGMPFILMVHISEYKAPNTVIETGSLGLGSGARRITSELKPSLGFPVDRPLNKWQVQHLKNFWFQDVVIYHKPTPEVVFFQ